MGSGTRGNGVVGTVRTNGPPRDHPPGTHRGTTVGPTVGSQWVLQWAHSGVSVSQRVF